MKKIEKTLEIGGRKLTLSSGHLAQQSDGAVMASYGETVVLATVVSAPLENYPGYFPLTVEYQERLYAGGRIKGSRWVKREGRPSDEEILIGRLVDRSVRPLFSSDYKNDVQIILTVLSVDLENSPTVPAAIAASAAIAISPIPWEGPVGTVRVGMKDGVFFTNPLEKELKYSDLDLVVSATEDAVVMIEAQAKEVAEDALLGAVEYAKDETKKIVKFINEIVEACGTKKEPFEKTSKDENLARKVKELALEDLVKVIKKLAIRESDYRELNELKKGVCESFADDKKNEVANLFDELLKSEVRKMILSGKRPDERKPTDIREISTQVGVLPRTHGSAIFERGQTQVLTVATLGSPSLEQLIERAEGEESKKYIHHYSMPPFSTGETGKMGSPSRREIGHGALAEKALIPVIPPESEFPYTIRVVSEVLSSNGSTSMASVCGSTLSLMDAGVPIKEAVAGIAMGLVIEDKDKFTVLTDIVGIEDGSGDMDFKVAGTRNGVTALQMDVKTLNLSIPILEKALIQAKEARTKILEQMKKTIGEPKPKVSVYAPKIKVLKVPTEKIGEVIGPGGRTIRQIIAETNAQVDIEDDGTVSISGVTEEEVSAAVSRVEALTREVKVGEVYEGEVKRIQPFGAFVEILPTKEGLVHVSDMAKEFVKDPSDLVKVGDKVTVKVKEIDDFGRLNLTMVLDEGAAGFSKDRDRERGGRRKFIRGGGRRPKGSGPHFPTSRFIGKDKRFSR